MNCRKCACASARAKFPSNALNYNLTWSTDGVINEYCEPCEAIVNGQLRETQPLEELESSPWTACSTKRQHLGRSRTLCEILAARCAISITGTSATPGMGHHEGAAKICVCRSARFVEDILENPYRSRCRTRHRVVHGQAGCSAVNSFKRPTRIRSTRHP